MSILDTLGLEERARQLRDPTGTAGLAVADRLGEINLQGNTRIVNDLMIACDDHVLELGCGTANMASIVVNKAQGVTYTGLDSSSTMIDAAGERNAALIEKGLMKLHHAYAEHMPLDEASFTKVFSIGLIHFWSDPIKALTEVRRVMRPDALMLMGGLGPERAPPFARLEYGFHLHGPHDWKTFCQAAGFIKVEVETRSMGAGTGPQLVHFSAHA